MATQYSLAHGAGAPDALANPFRWLGAVAWFFGALARAQETTQAYERLSAQSDETLAEQGLTREELPLLAFRRHFQA